MCAENISCSKEDLPIDLHYSSPTKQWNTDEVTHNPASCPIQKKKKIFMSHYELVLVDNEDFFCP